MITLKGITKSYSDFEVLHNITMSIKKGEIYGFLGHNGSGKTSTLKIITGLMTCDSGQVVFKDQKLKIGYMPESPKFYDYLTLKEFMVLIGSQNKIKIQNEEVLSLIERVGLKTFENKRVEKFSRGMKQRAALACALIGDPDVLLLDEPLSALDPEGRKDVVEMIQELKKQGKTILISTHILSDVENICDTIGVLKNGNIIFEDRLKDLKEEFVFPILDICFKSKIEIISVDDFDEVEKIYVGDECCSFYLKNIGEGKNEILRYITRNQLEIISLNQRNSSLEDIYLELVKEGEGE